MYVETSLSGGWIANGIASIVQGASSNTGNGANGEDIVLIIGGSINLVIGVLGLVSCFTGMACGATLMFYCYAITFVITVFAIVFQWIAWGTRLNATPPTINYQSWMTTWTISQCIILVASYFVCNIFFSMASV
eukprot:GHVN01037005.1.p1 GENE.GHVN01037005.1~~GHVN01037005.1.p1  ORF type:complete len:134 (-),score=11.22 GHVN01037005.1:576-977(-)